MPAHLPIHPCKPQLYNSILIDFFKQPIQLTLRALKTPDTEAMLILL